MFLFNKSKLKKNENKESYKPITPVDIYLRNVNEYIEFYASLLEKENPLDDLNFYNRFAVPYYNAATQIAEYFKEKFPDIIFMNRESVEFDWNDFLNSVSDDTKKFLLEPRYPSLIYINNHKYSTHFHVDNGIVTEAESVEVLPGLSKTLANIKINKLFMGLSVVEVKDLLSQMNILPENTELEGCINMHNKYVYLNKKFLESTLCLLLIINKNSPTIERARFFAKNMGITFDFSPFIKKKNNYDGLNDEKKLIK